MRNNPSLFELPIFSDILEEQLDKDKQTGNGVFPVNPIQRETNTSKLKLEKENDQPLFYLSPLSTYSAVDDLPYIPRNEKSYYTESMMKMDQREQKLQNIRYLGSNIFRPIGLWKTRYELQQEAQNELHSRSNIDEDNSAALNLFQENRYSNNTFNFHESRPIIDASNDIDDNGGNERITSNYTDDIDYSMYARSVNEDFGGRLSGSESLIEEETPMIADDLEEEADEEYLE